MTLYPVQMGTVIFVYTFVLGAGRNARELAVHEAGARKAGGRSRRERMDAPCPPARRGDGLRLGTARGVDGERGIFDQR